MEREHSLTRKTGNRHNPVLLAEVLAALQPKDGEIYVDGTFGYGGYSRAILEAANCRLISMDQDSRVNPRATLFAADFPDRFRFIEGCFGDVETYLGEIGQSAIDGLVLDLGVSSMQLDEPQRGFSFRADGPLDMRMGARMARTGEEAEAHVKGAALDAGERPSAAHFIAHTDEAELADILYHYGEERHARAVARAIIRARDEQGPITRTLQLAEIIRAALRRVTGGKSARMKIDPATRSFMAIRIHINDELGELRRVLAAAERILSPGGRLVIVTFHSLEDRIVKHFLRERAGLGAQGSRHRPIGLDAKPSPSFTLVSRKAVEPSAREAAENPRARSARLRAAIRTEHPSWPIAGGAA